MTTDGTGVMVADRAAGWVMTTSSRFWQGAKAAAVMMLVAAPVLYVGTRAETGALAVRDFGVADASRLLSALLFVALFAERALEVFVSVWREPAADEIDLRLQRAQARQDQLKGREGPELQAAAAAVDATLREQMVYRAGTKKIALRAGLIFGIAMSAVGFRALSEIVQAAPAAGFQGAAFTMVDILLTGAVIAGGADGIHQITNVYTDFMTSTSSRIKAPAPQGQGPA